MSALTAGALARLACTMHQALDLQQNTLNTQQDELDGVKIYLDDIRVPKQDFWTIVRTPEEFRHVITHADEIHTISFDHDLGECESGHDLMKWLIDLHLDGHKDLSHTQVFVHSANPVGARNMQMLWSNFKRTL